MIRPNERRLPARGPAGPVTVLALALAIGLAGCGGGGGANGKYGDCAKDGTGTDDVTIVPCSSADAKYKIVGAEEGIVSSSANLSCQKYKTATKSLWFGKSGSYGRVICLQELR